MRSRLLRSALGILWILIFALAVLPGTANAVSPDKSGTMTLVAVVPPCRCFDLVVNGEGGTVEIQDARYLTSGLVELEESQDILIAISSDTGYYLQSVYWNGELQAENQRNYSFLLAKIPRNAELTVTFAEIPASVYVAGTAMGLTVIGGTATAAWALSGAIGGSVLGGSAAGIRGPFANSVKRFLKLLKKKSETDP